MLPPGEALLHPARLEPGTSLSAHARNVHMYMDGAACRSTFSAPEMPETPFVIAFVQPALHLSFPSKGWCGALGLT
jgi:hypothetical protein